MAGPIWNKFMTEALKVLPNEAFEIPNLELSYELKPILRGYWQGGESFLVDRISGKLATPETPPETIEERVVTNVHSILHWVKRADPLGPAPENPAADPQYSHWEIPIQNWWAQNRANYQTTAAATKPSSLDDVHTALSKPKISIITPDQNSLYAKDERIDLKLSSSGIYALSKIDVFVNNAYLGSASAPISFSFTPEELDNLKEENEIRVIAYDSAWNRAESVSTFRVKN